MKHETIKRRLTHIPTKSVRFDPEGSVGVPSRGEASARLDEVPTAIPRGWTISASSPEAIFRSRTEVRFRDRLECEGRLGEWEAYLESSPLK